MDFSPAAFPAYDAPVHLPSGVKLVGMEFYGWDVNGGFQFQAGLVNACDTKPGAVPPPPAVDPDWGTPSRLSTTPGSGAAVTPGIVRLNGSTV